MDFADLHPYVYYATRYPFSKGQASNNRISYASSIYLISEGKGVVHTFSLQTNIFLTSFIIVMVYMTTTTMMQVSTSKVMKSRSLCITIVMNNPINIQHMSSS